MKIPKEVAALLEEDAGKGFENVRITDRAFWLDEDPENQDWYVAFEAIDKKGDKGPLLALLTSRAELTPNVRRHLANLLARYHLRRPPNRPAMPSYDKSKADAFHLMAKERVHDLVQHGVKKKDAIAKAAKEYASYDSDYCNISEKSLTAFLKNKK